MLKIKMRELGAAALYECQSAYAGMTACYALLTLKVQV